MDGERVPLYHAVPTAETRADFAPTSSCPPPPDLRAPGIQLELPCVYDATTLGPTLSAQRIALGVVPTA